MKLVVLMSLAGFGVGCGGHAEPDPVVVGCVEVASIDDLSPVVDDSFAGTDLDGRWFLESPTASYQGNMWLERQGSRLEINHAYAIEGGDTRFSSLGKVRNTDGSFDEIVTEIANYRSDDTMRYETLSCAGGTCTRCTSKMIRATRFQGEAEADHLALVGELGSGPTWSLGYTLNVRVAGTIAYLIRRDGLHVIETADPAHPVEVGFYTRMTLGVRNDLKLFDVGPRRFAVLADTPLDIVEVTDPRAPTLVSQIPEAAHTVFVEPRDGKVLAYLGSLDGTCPVYDLSDPGHPTKVGSFDAEASYVHDLSVKDGIAYLNAWEKGFIVVDFTTPAAPRVLGTWANTPLKASHSNWTTVAGGRHVALHGDEGYGAHLDVVDLDPASPTFMQSIASWQAQPWVSIHNIMAFGNKAYFAYYQDGIRVLDLSDPLHPAELGHYDTWDPQSTAASSEFFTGAFGLDVDLARKLVFVADSPRGLVILADQTADR